MQEHRPEPSAPVLTKEVAPPRAGQSGAGVLIVASVAMLFALASAGLLVHARIAGEPCPYIEAQSSAAEPGERFRAQSAAQRQAESTAAGLESSSTSSRCGEAVYREKRDGSVTVTFDLCGDRRAAKRELEGVEVRALHLD